MKPFVADLHMHSVLSGHAFGTIRELAAEAANRGMKLIGVTEHAPGIPGTCDPIYFRNFCDAPRKLYGVEMLYGSEVNVLTEGSFRSWDALLGQSSAGIVQASSIYTENCAPFSTFFVRTSSFWMLKLNRGARLK